MKKFSGHRSDHDLDIQIHSDVPINWILYHFKKPSITLKSKYATRRYLLQSSRRDPLISNVTLH